MTARPSCAVNGSPTPEMVCPATMCPLIAKDGSPWTGQKAAPCPEHDEIDDGGCAWWGIACKHNGIQASVEDAAANGGKAHVAGPNKPRRLTSAPRSYQCEWADRCQWQARATAAGKILCPPRDALAKGIDPRVCLF